MKRLLACLFLIIGLGLLFSVNVVAAESFCISKGRTTWMPHLIFSMKNTSVCDGTIINQSHKAFALVKKKYRAGTTRDGEIMGISQLTYNTIFGKTQIIKKESTQTQQVARAVFCLNKSGDTRIRKLVGSEEGCPNQYKIISMREHVDIKITLYLTHSFYRDSSESAYISVFKSFKSTFTKLNLDTTYLDSEIIKNFSNQVNKNKLLTALNIAKESTEEQILASINMTKEEYEPIKKVKEEQRLKAEELRLILEEDKLKAPERKRKREEVQRLVEAEELRLKDDPWYRAESELDISIKKATQETDIIKVNEAYSLKCEAEIEDFNFVFNQRVVKSKTLKTESILDFGQDGQAYFTMNQKISSSGKLSNSKLKLHYSPDFDKDLKNSIKPYVDMYKHLVKEGFTSSILYGKTLKPIQIENKKKSKKALSFVKKMLANDAEMKPFAKKLKVKIYEHYLGTASIQSEEFYILQHYVTMEHPDESFLDVVGEEMSQTTYTIIHIASAYGLQLDKEMATICTIYKQDKELIKYDSSEIFD